MASFVEPLRPVLGGVATLFLGFVLYRRARALRAGCPSCAVEPVSTGTTGEA